MVSEKRIAAQFWERAWWRVILRWRRVRASAREVGVGRVCRRERKSSSAVGDGGDEDVWRVARVSRRDVGRRDEASSGSLVMDDSAIVE